MNPTPQPMSTTPEPESPNPKTNISPEREAPDTARELAWQQLRACEAQNQFALTPQEREHIVRCMAGWINIAQQHLRNQYYYHALLIKCGQAIGTPAYIADDGTRQQDVLCSKVPELVEQLCAAQDAVEYGLTGAPVNTQQDPADQPDPETPLHTQVGGDHYRSCGVQPLDYIYANQLGPCEANVLKYITRHRQKNGQQDIEKAIHYLQLLLQYEYSA